MVLNSMSPQTRKVPYTPPPYRLACSQTRGQAIAGSGNSVTPRAPATVVPISGERPRKLRAYCRCEYDLLLRIEEGGAKGMVA